MREIPQELRDDGINTRLVEYLASSAGMKRFFGDRYADRFDLVEELGRGGTSEVWKARDHHAGGMTVALKVYDLLGPPESVRHLFDAETLRARSINSSGVVKVVDAAFDADASTAWVACEYVEGGELGRIDAKQNLPETLRRFAALADGVQSVHAAGLIHRDIKPSNVLVRGDRLVLADLGSCLETSGGDTTSRGTPLFSAPEQLGGAAPNVAQDVYGLAGSLLWSLTGMYPNTRDGERADLTFALGLVRDDLASVIRRGLSEDPSRRHASASEFAADLRLIAEGRPLSGASAVRRVSLFVRRHKLGTLAIAGLVALGAFGIHRQARLASETAYKANFSRIADMFNASALRWEGSDNYGSAVLLSRRHTSAADSMSEFGVVEALDDDLVSIYARAYESATGIERASVGTEYAFLLVQANQCETTLRVAGEIQADHDVPALDAIAVVARARMAVDGRGRSALEASREELESLGAVASVHARPIETLRLAALVDVYDALGMVEEAAEAVDEHRRSQGP